MGVCEWSGCDLERQCKVGVASSFWPRPHSGVLRLVWCIWQISSFEVSGVYSCFSTPPALRQTAYILSTSP